MTLYDKINSFQTEADEMLKNVSDVRALRPTPAAQELSAPAARILSELNYAMILSAVKRMLRCFD